MKKITNGEIWLVKFPDTAIGCEQAKTRPCIILNHQPNSPVCHVVPLTSATKRPMKVHIPVPLDASSGLNAPSTALCEQATLVAHERCLKKLGSVNDRVMFLVKQAVVYALGLI